MGSDIVINSALKNTLTSIKRTRESLDATSLRIATGNRVNSPLDQPQNFFQASDLRRTNQNFNSLFDKMNLGLRTIQEALIGLEAIEELLNLAEIKANEAKEALEATSSALPNLILDAQPVGYFQLNDVNTGTALNLGTLGAGGDGTVNNGVRQADEILFYGAGSPAARFDGNPGDFIAVPVDDSINTLGPYDEKTIELIFNADTVSGRRVLFEEGGPVNNLNIYIDDGVLRVNGRTTNGVGYGPLDISVPIEAGVTYHVSLVQDANNNRFSGYLNGELFGSAFIPVAIGSHPNRNAIGAIDQDIYFHDDGPGNAPNRPDGTFAFQGEISDVAFYNSIISQEDLRARYEATSLPLAESFREEIIVFIEQIEDITKDSNFRGLNLLRNEDLVVNFDDENESKLRVDGQNFTVESLGLANINFQNPTQVETALRNLTEAIEQVREYATTISRDINIIQIRQDYTKNFINVNESGAIDLTIADQNEEGANLLAQETRLALSTTALGLAGQSSRSILEIFGTGSDLFRS